MLGFALGLVQMILYGIYRNGNKKASPQDSLKSVVVANSLGGVGEVFSVEEDVEKGMKREEEEKKKNMEEV